MSWTLLAPKDNSSPGYVSLRLPNDGVAHIVKTPGDTAIDLVHKLNRVHTVLGRITVGPWGAKLEAVDDVLSILPGHANLPPTTTNDPRTVRYELQPRADGRSEAILLRHGDLISSSKSTASLTCRYAPEVQVTSSAVVNETEESTYVMDGVAETPEEETEDEDLDNTGTAVKATQGQSQPPQATPQLSNQRSVVVQETPTVARINGVTDYSAAHKLKMEADQSEPLENTPLIVSANQVDLEPYSTARTGQSQNGGLEDTKESNDGELEQTSDTSERIDTSSNTADGPSDDIPQKTRHPKVLILKKRPSPVADEQDSEAEPVGRPSKRARRNLPSDNDTQDSRLSNVVVDVLASKARKKRVSEVNELEEITEATPPRSQRSSQRSNAAATAELYEGATPWVATSNSSLTDKSHAVKFLKKQGGSLVDSVKEDFNVLCVRNGNLHKTPKVLQAIAAGTPIVTDKWLTDSAKAGHFLSVDAYIPSAPKQEKEWKFKLKDVFGQPQTPFKGYTVHFTSSLHAVYKPFTEIEQVCKAAGAAKVTKKKMDKSGNIIVLAMEDGDKEAEKLIEEGTSCYSRDLIPTGIFRGFIDLDSDEFKISIGGDASTGKQTKKKRTRKSTG